MAEAANEPPITERVVKFVPFSSTADFTFWVRYCQLKLDDIRLREDPIEILASYGAHVANQRAATGEKATTANNNSNNNRLRCQESSLLWPERRPSKSNEDSDKDDHDDNDFLLTNDRVACPGVLIGYNTKESFQGVNKNELLKTLFFEQFFGEQQHTPSETAAAKPLKHPSLVLLTFADLKQHKVLYWFGFPTLMTKTPILAKLLPEPKQKKAKGWWEGLAAALHDHRVTHESMPAYFAVPGGSFSSLSSSPPRSALAAPLDGHYKKTPGLGVSKESGSSKSKSNDAVFCFLDPTPVVSARGSGGDGAAAGTAAASVLLMGWPMRNLIAYLVLHLGLGGEEVSILSLRPGGCPGLRGRVSVSDPGPTKQQQQQQQQQGDADRLARDSVLMTITLPIEGDYRYGTETDSGSTKQAYKVVGWELNARHKPGPKWVNLKPLLDQNHLAIQAADLNLKLMKWRMIPDLNVNMLQNNCRVLLLGAGTLGCSVARTLLGWGIRDFTFVDNGTVSYSNTVRQILFNLEDCRYDHGRGKPKAQAAADALKLVAADVISEGVKLSIPMPGHASENDESLRETVETLDRLIRETDAIFLLTDTRESRWLPTVMAATHDKVLINAALGLDSWLVMRHGGGCEPQQQQQQPPPPSASSSAEARAEAKLEAELRSNNHPPRLGCYFCNDVVAPENSTKNRTLDQQCTVTRPGLAPIASSMAVEMLVSLLHHPLKHKAPGPVVKNHKTAGSFAPSVSSGSSKSPLGIVPHQIRGSIVTYTMMTPTVPAFQYCTGCARPVLDAYKTDAFGLVSLACASMNGSFLEDLSGLTAFRADLEDKYNDLDELDFDVDSESESDDDDKTNDNKAAEALVP